jgi:hypothetical protein
VGVGGGEQHADVGGDAGDDQAAYAELGEQDRQVGGVEAGKLRLDDEVIVAAWGDLAGDFAAGTIVGLSSLDNAGLVGVPSAVVVVDVDHRDFEPVGFFAQLQNDVRDLIGLGTHGLSAWKIHRVDHVDDQQTDAASGAVLDLRGVLVLRHGLVL